MLRMAPRLRHGATTLCSDMLLAKLDIHWHSVGIEDRDPADTEQAILRDQQGVRSVLSSPSRQRYKVQAWIRCRGR